MRMEEVMDLIGRLEDELPVDTWIVDSVHLWPLVRLHLSLAFLDYHFFQGTPRAGAMRIADVVRVSRRVLGALWRSRYASLRDREKDVSPREKADVLFLNYDAYMTLMGGLWYSRLCDPLATQLLSRGLSCLMLTAGYTSLVPRFSPSAFVQPALIACRAAGLLSGAVKSEPSGEFAEVEATVKKSGLFPESFRVLRPVLGRLSQIRRLERYFVGVLADAGPKVVFVSCYYNTESMGLLLACRRLGIPTVDIQHGVQGHDHVAYGRFHRVPSGGYELLPTLFWCWSSAEADAIGRWSKRAGVHRTVVGGNLFLNRWLDDADEVVRRYDEKIIDVKAGSTSRFHALYTLNGCTRGELETVVRIIEGMNERGLLVQFWVRLHPVTIEQKGRVKRFLKDRGIENVDVDYATELPLYAILRHMDVHVTEFSSVVLEAEALGVPSVIYRLGVESFPRQVAEGWAVPAWSIGEVVAGMQSLLGRRHVRESSVEGARTTSEAALGQLLEMVS